jgi:hypothetical protein
MKVLSFALGFGTVTAIGYVLNRAVTGHWKVTV